MESQRDDIERSCGRSSDDRGQRYASHIEFYGGGGLPGRPVADFFLSSEARTPERGVGIDRSCSGPLGSTLQGPQITDADLLKSATLRGRR